MQELDDCKISFEMVCKKNRNYIKQKDEEIISLPQFAWRHEEESNNE